MKEPILISFTVNGRPVTSPHPGKSLLRFLRDDLRLTSVKEGCGEGACGTCTVLADGKPTRACVPTMAKMAGKSVLTVEGLSAREKEIFAHCFAQVGAVQCGFCIPGMVISAKGLLDRNPDPSRADVKRAIRGNICRCTGYAKIEDALLLAASFLREGVPIPLLTFTGKLGEDFHRVDAEEKVLGTGLYTDDITIDGMVYAGVLRTRYPRARVLAIDCTAAEAHLDCLRVITAADVPGDIKCGHLIRDWDALIAVGGITRYVGDALALAVSTSQESLDEVLSLIRVEYEALTPLTSPAQSLSEGAPPIHEGGNLLSRQVLKRGDANAAIAAAAHVVTEHYSLPFTEHAFMEPECAIAMPEGDGGLLLYTGGQNVYDERREISRLLGIPAEKVHVRSMLVGGGFGGKEDMSVQHHAALAAWLVGRPVKIRFSRSESLLVHPKRHAMEIDLTAACDENGFLTAVRAEIVADTGAYASLGGPVLQRACTHAAGPYNFQNVDITGMAVYTNNPPAGAFRGFGVTQTAFAMECTLNRLAEKAGLSPWEIRFRNAVRPGQVLPNGQIADESTAMAECLLAVKDVYDRAPYAGIASCFKNAGLGVGVQDIGRCVLSVEEGKIHIRSGAACIGQGMATVLIQMVCQTLDIAPGLLVVEPPDTARAPDAGTTTASRQTLFSGEAAVIAAKKLREAARGFTSPGAFVCGHTPPPSAEGGLLRSQEIKPELLPFSETEGYFRSRKGVVSRPQAPSFPQEGGVRPALCKGLTEDVPHKTGFFWEEALALLDGLEFSGEYRPETDPMGSDKPFPVSHVAYSYAAQVAELDAQGRVIKITAAYDIGTVVNPTAARGQIEGGVVMGMGYALAEDFPVQGGCPTAKYGTLGLLRAPDAPEIDVVFVNSGERLPAAYGAKGVGELAAIPTAPAIQGVYYKLDGVFRRKLPMKDTFYNKK